MAISLAASGLIDVNNVTSGTSASFTSSAGDVLYVVVSDNNAAATISDNKSNSWTQIGTDLTAGVVVGQRWYCVPTTTGTGHTITVTFSGVANSTPVWTRITGAAASPLDASGSTQGLGLSRASNTLAQANNLVISDVFCDGSAGSYTAGGGFTKYQEQVNDSLYWTQAASSITTSSTTAVTPSWTVSGNTGGGAGMFTTVFKEASGGGTDTPLTVTSASLSVTGQDVILTLGGNATIGVTEAALLLAGQDVSLVAGSSFTIPVTNTSLSLAGSDVLFSYESAWTEASIVLTGQNVTLTAQLSITLPVTEAALTLAGSDVTLLADFDYTVGVTEANLSLTGSDVTFQISAGSVTVQVDSSNLLLTASDIGISPSFSLPATGIPRRKRHRGIRRLLNIGR